MSTTAASAAWSRAMSTFRSPTTPRSASSPGTSTMPAISTTSRARPRHSRRRTFPTRACTDQQRAAAQEQLQRRRHLWRPRRAEDRPRRTTGRSRRRSWARRRRRNGSYAYDPTVGDLEGPALLPGIRARQLVSGRADRPGQDQQLSMSPMPAATWTAGSIAARTIPIIPSSTTCSMATAPISPTTPATPINPSQHIVGKDHFTKKSHELRFASPAGRSLPRSSPACSTSARSTASTRITRSTTSPTRLSVPGWPNTLWLTDRKRVDRDYAAFGEASFDITPAVTLTLGGARASSRTIRSRASSASAKASSLSGVGTGMSQCFAARRSSATRPAPISTRSPTHYGYTHKVNLTWQVDDDHMLYATSSTGFRPGGVNRNADVTASPTSRTT